MINIKNSTTGLYLCFDNKQMSYKIYQKLVSGIILFILFFVVGYKKIIYYIYNLGLSGFRGIFMARAGQGAGLDDVTLGEKGGPEQVNITPSEEGKMYQTQAPYCGINFIICLYGMFPPKN